jgi:hypothetical protein
MQLQVIAASTATLPPSTATLPPVLYTKVTDMGVHLAEIRQRLGKKTTFEAAVADLQAIVSADPGIAANAGFQDIVQRSAALLKSRYTSPAFWSAGRRLYEAARVSAGTGKGIASILKAHSTSPMCMPGAGWPVLARLFQVHLVSVSSHFCLHPGDTVVC